MDNVFGSRGNRKLQNFLIAPRAQLGAFAMVFLVGFAAVCFMFAMIVQRSMEIMSSLTGISPTAAEIADVAAAQSQLMRTVFFTLVVVFFLISFLLVVALTHRYEGPLVPIRRQVRKMIEGDYSGRLHLRKTDQLKELANDLNALAEKLGGGLGDAGVAKLSEPVPEGQ